MSDYRRIALWVFALVMPGGILLLPVLIADLRRRGFRKSKRSTPVSEHPSAPIAA
jgi:hypothetical protein